MIRSLPVRLVLALTVSTAVCLAALSAQSNKQAKPDAQIKQEIIAASLASYRGNCPCPYNTDRAGRKCGRRSAYSRPGGASPICYPEDVTAKMIEAFKAKGGKPAPIE